MVKDEIMQRRARHASRVHQLGRFGFLFADLFVVLAMIFLAAATREPPPVRAQSAPAGVTPIVTIDPAPGTQVCGLDPNPGDDFDQIVTIPNSDLEGLLQGAGTAAGDAARQDFARYARNNFLAGYGGKTAGFVEVLGGTSATGEALSQGIMDAFQLLGQSGFLFSSTPTRKTRYFHKAFEAPLPSNQAEIYVIFYLPCA
jgi:hypothetical protein